MKSQLSVELKYLWKFHDRKTLEVASRFSFTSENYTCCCAQNSTSSFIIFHKWNMGQDMDIGFHLSLVWSIKPRQSPRLHNSTKKSRSKWRTFMDSRCFFFFFCSFTLWKLYEWIFRPARSFTSDFHSNIFDALFHLFYYESNATRGDWRT